MMDPTLEGSLPDTGAMDLYASIPPSGPPIEQLDEPPLPPLPFSESLMEGSFPPSGISVFDDPDFTPVASTSNLETPLLDPSGEHDPPQQAIEAVSTVDFEGGDEDNDVEAQMEDLDPTTRASSSSQTATATTTTTSTKRRRGRPKKPPNAPTRTKYARITKEEMLSDDDIIGYKPTSTGSILRRPPSSLNSTDLVSSNSSELSDAKGKGKRTASGPSLSVETRTKSGRTVHKPETFVPTFEPAFRRKKAAQARASSELSHCAICGQNRSTASDQLFLCDSCHTPYHQQCHEPPIPAYETAQEPNPPWYCSNCETQRSTFFPHLSWGDSLPASSFPETSVSSYLDILPRAHLVQIIHSVIQHYPDAKLFPANLPQLLEADAVRKAHAREARPRLATNKSSSSTALLEPSAKRKRGGSLHSSQLDYETDESGSGSERRRRTSKTPRLATSTSADLSTTFRTSTTSAAGMGEEGGQSGSSPSKGEATTQTDDYLYDESGRRIRLSSHPEDRPDAMSYFEMLRNALRDINEPEGVPPRRLYEWISDRYALPDNFRPSAGQALQKAAKKGHFLKTGSLYRVNPEHENMKPVKRPVRKNRPSDASQPTPTAVSGTSTNASAHQRNLSNQTTSSARSTITSVSNDGSRHTAISEALTEEKPDSIQGESTRSTISLEEVIARQHNNAQQQQQQALKQQQQSFQQQQHHSVSQMLNPSPSSAFVSVTEAVPAVPSAISPEALPLNVGGSYFPPNAFEPSLQIQQQQAAQQQQSRHQRHSISFPTTNFVTPPVMNTPQTHLQHGQYVFQPDVRRLRQVENQVSSTGQQHAQQASVPVYTPSGDAGIDSMLADLMRQSPADRTGMQSQASQRSSTATVVSPPSTMPPSQRQQQQQQQQQMQLPPSTAELASPTRQHSQVVQSQSQTPSLTPQMQPHMPQQQSQQAQQQQQQQHHQLGQGQPISLAQQQLAQYQAQTQNAFLANPTDSAIYSGIPQYAAPSSQQQAGSPQMQAYHAQYAYQPAQMQPQQQQSARIQQQQQAQQVPQLQQQQQQAPQYNSTIYSGQEARRSE